MASHVSIKSFLPGKLLATVNSGAEFEAAHDMLLLLVSGSQDHVTKCSGALKTSRFVFVFSVPLEVGVVSKIPVTTITVVLLDIFFLNFIMLILWWYYI